jgi:ATP-dependent Clp protease adaptor protein ClpS
MPKILEKIGTWLSESLLPADKYGVIPFSVELRAEMQNESNLDNYALEIINDNHTPMEYVVEVFCIKFGLSKSDAVEKMLQIHRTGSSVALVHSESIVSKAAIEIESESKNKGYHLYCRSVPSD